MNIKDFRIAEREGDHHLGRWVQMQLLELKRDPEGKLAVQDSSRVLVVDRIISQVEIDNAYFDVVTRTKSRMRQELIEEFFREI